MLCLREHDVKESNKERKEGERKKVENIGKRKEEGRNEVRKEWEGKGRGKAGGRKGRWEERG